MNRKERLTRTISKVPGRGKRYYVENAIQPTKEKTKEIKGIKGQPKRARKGGKKKANKARVLKVKKRSQNGQ